MKPLVRWTLLVLFWTMVFLGAAELVLRYTGKYDSWIERNGFDYISPYAQQTRHDSWLHLGRDVGGYYESMEFMHAVRFNHEKLRDTDHPKEKTAGEYRIVTLGDSFTEGMGVEFPDTWHQQLGRQLGETFPQQQFRIINGGVSGSDPWFEYMLLKEKLIDYQPDMVMVAVNATDVTDMICRGGDERFLPNGTIAYKEVPRLDWWYEHSHVARMVLMDILQFDWLYLSKAQRRQAEQEAIDEIAEALLKMHALAKEAGSQMVVVFHPVLHEMEAGKYSYNYWDVEEALIRNDIRVINLLPHFQTYIESTGNKYIDYYWPIDEHHNDRGYTLFADAVLQGMQRIDLLEAMKSKDTMKSELTFNNSPQ